jgi:hypothetical protein
MQKIISLFQRNYDGDRLVRDEVVPGAEWVIAGEGVATRKWDGTCCMVRDGKLYKRYEVKPGKKPPVNFEPATGVDVNTGKQQGWVPVGDGPEDKWHREAFDELRFTSGTGRHPDGTYELCGPNVQGNPEHLARHYLIPHGKDVLEYPPERTFAAIRYYLDTHDFEGIVWRHPDGRMVKIKKKDFGLKRS